MRRNCRMTIEVKNLVKKFGAFAALDGVDLKIGNGELLALLGPSGSGKTTLLRIIAGLDWPDLGEVSFDGENALVRGAGERQVGFVFQHYALFRHMTVFENVAFGMPGDVYDNPATAFVHGFIGESIVLPVNVSDGRVRLGDKALKIAAEGASSGASKLFVRRHDMQVGPAGSGSLEGSVRQVRSFGPIQRAVVALCGGEIIEIDAPRDRELQAGEIVGLEPRRYRIFAA